jgi:hypothetical protein
VTVQPENRIYLVHEADDDRDALTFLRSLRGPRERVVCELTPRNAKTRGSLDWLVNDLLRALGKDTGLGARNAQAAYDALIAWLVADDVEDLVIVRAHALSAGAWSTLTELAALADARLWLMYQQPKLARGHREWCESFAPTELDFSAFKQRWGVVPKRSASPTPAVVPFPAVPQTDFLLFRAEARELLTADEFKLVNKSYRDAMEKTQAWLDDAETPDADALAAYLHDLTADCASTAEALTRLRAAQATMFVRGWWTIIDARVFIAAQADAHLSFDDATASALRRFLSPQYAAAATLALTANATYTALAGLKLSDVETDGARVRLGGRDWQLDASARPLLRAQVIARVVDGACDDDPLFGDRTACDPAAPASARALRKSLDKAREVGVRCTRNWNSQKPASATTTMRRVGVTVQALP